MDFLREQLDKAAKLFEKGGKLEPLYPFYEAPDTILYTPGTVTKGRTHIRDAFNQKRMMISVVFALLPICLFAMWNAGWQATNAVAQGATPWDGWQTWVYEWVGLAYDSQNPLLCIILGSLYFIPLLIVVGAVGGHIEMAFATIRKHEVTEGFLVTWFLFTLIVPPTLPLWQAALGIAFGVIIGKEIFGGVGMNVLNPALTGRAFLFFAYPAEISGDKVWTAATANGVDGWSGATPLAKAAVDGLPALTEAETVFMEEPIMESFIGFVPGSMGETSALLCIVAAVFLVIIKVGSWKTMAGVALGTTAMAMLLNAVGSETNPMFEIPFYWHMVLGGWAFGTVFMATDPVSSAFTDRGKWIYGFGIGVMVILVRVINPAYPEGMMLAILFMNMFAPLIDHFVVNANIKRREANYGEAT
jgi:Na+-transporting NADH:ubiquinone oxidoreductase subunit B